jgi:hypothetical protein
VHKKKKILKKKKKKKKKYKKNCKELYGRRANSFMPTYTFNWKYMILATFTGKSDKTYVPRKKKVL